MSASRRPSGVNNQESLRLQYALRQRACDLGWRELMWMSLMRTSASAAPRLFAEKASRNLSARRRWRDRFGLSIDVTRLARNCSDWYPLLDVCGHRSCLIADRTASMIQAANGRLLLGLKALSRTRTSHHPWSSDIWLLAKALEGSLPDAACWLRARLQRKVTKDQIARFRSVSSLFSLAFSDSARVRR